jgi:hypothetical protein
MDDFVLSNLHESKNEWASRLLTILTPLVIEGLRSIFDEAVLLCKSNNEMDKYLMTFQNFISRIPKWNSNIIEVEKNRIINKSSCTYLEDLVTCVHIIQLKLLTAIRVGQKQKKIDINIPKLDDFIHKIYINVARKTYKNVYLFEINIAPLQVQKHHRELEIIIQECILNTVRESIPVEAILRAYMDETIEEDYVEEIKEQVIDPPITMEDIEREKVKENAYIITEEATQPSTTDIKSTSHLESDYNEKFKNIDIAPTAIDFPELSEDTSLRFNDVDMVRDVNNVESKVIASKDIDRLEEISNLRNAQRKSEEDDSQNTNDTDDNVKLKIFEQDIVLDNLDIHNIEEPKFDLGKDFLLNEVEVLY